MRRRVAGSVAAFLAWAEPKAEALNGYRHPILLTIIALCNGCV
jgi:hypothetical protein